MKPPPFEYFRPRSVPEALEALAEHGSDVALLAGGQSLIASLNFRCLTPKQLVDINDIAELSHVTRHEDGQIRIGAMTRQAFLERDETVARHLPLMHYAVPFIAHAAIRSRGTIGGSLAYADPAGEQGTITMALGAQYHLISKRGERHVPAESFFKTQFKTELAEDEMLRQVILPPLPEHSGWGFAEVARRHGDRVLMGVAAVVELDEQHRCNKARLVYQNAGPTPILATQAAGALLGQVATPELLGHAAHHAATLEIDPDSDVHASAAYRRHLAEVLTVRVLHQAFARARGEQVEGDCHVH